MIRNHHLSRGISDVSWGKFKDYVVYKAKESNHCNILLMHPFYPSSKLCSHCRSHNPNLKLSDRKWTCIHCDTIHERDHNASMNILRKSIEMFKQLSPKGEWINTPVLCNPEY